MKLKHCHNYVNLANVGGQDGQDVWWSRHWVVKMLGGQDVRTYIVNNIFVNNIFVIS